MSLVPFVEDLQEGDGVGGDFWETSDEFLESQSGDWEEHAVLLCNYFKHFGQDAYVLVGDAAPEGDTCYVLTRNNQDGTYLLWNPSLGEAFRPDDPICPVRDVSMIFNEHNVWANKQPPTSISQVDFDLSKSSNWKPFFTSKKGDGKPGAFPTIQKTNLTYYDPDMTNLWGSPGSQERRNLYAADLEKQLERDLTKRFEQWRADAPKSMRTQWVRRNTGFKAALEHCEAIRCGRDLGQNQEKSMQDLKHFQQMYEVNGFPLNQTFESFDKLAELVFGTDIHENYNPDVMFALSVRCDVYPNKVISCWVFIASLIRRK